MPPGLIRPSRQKSVPGPNFPAARRFGVARSARAWQKRLPKQDASWEGSCMSSADIGLIGLAVMGSNLALNIADNGYTVAVHNRTAARIDDFVATAKEQGLDGKVIPKADLADFIQTV